ncbi:MAG TPA: hypothetical protein VFV32_08540 [Acidimicrobiales bacterium]|nr:hypothetical protein [Acidimicrobiales bacterium]
MSEELVEPDLVVRTALQLLPVPDHGPDFWYRVATDLDVEEALRLTADADAPAVPAAPVRARSPRRAAPPTVPLVELVPAPGAVPPTMRRRSNLVLSAVAVAAAIAVVVAGTSLVRSRTGSDAATEVAEGPEETTTSEAPAASSSISTLAAPHDEPAVAAVVAWVNALGQGDVDAAWSALGPASQAHWGSKSAFTAERSGLAEGYGAWSAADPDDILLTPLSSSGEGELVVVTLVGTLQQEGPEVARADAFPVRIVDGTAKVELFAYAGELEVVVPEPVPEGGRRPVVAPGDELVVVVPSDAAAPVIRLDDGEVLVCGDAPGTRLTALEGSSGRRCGYTPKGGIPKGQRVLTVAYTSTDGAEVSAESVRFTAA